MGATMGGLSRSALLPNLSSSAGRPLHRTAIRRRRRDGRMRCSSLVLRPEPRCEIVERDAQSRGNLGERGEAAGFAARFDLGQIARRNPGGGGEGVAAEAAMGAPNADRVLAGAEASDQLDRQIVGARLLFAERGLARLGRSNRGEVFGILEALDQRLVLGAAERDGLARVAHRYASLRCATVSRTIVSAVWSMRQIPRQSPWRRRITCGRPRSGAAAGCTANGAAAKAPALSSNASRSRLGILARAFDAARVTISLMSPSSSPVTGPSTTIVSESDKERGLLSQIPQLLLARADEVIE